MVLDAIIPDVAHVQKFFIFKSLHDAPCELDFQLLKNAELEVTCGGCPSADGDPPSDEFKYEEITVFDVGLVGLGLHIIILPDHTTAVSLIRKY